jgi:hypothetical protein
MSTRRNLSSSLLATTLLAASIVGCQPQAQVQERANKGPHITHEDVTSRPNHTSNGIVVRNDLAMKLNKTKGFRNASVLMYNGNAYVGVTSVGSEKRQDAAIKSGDNWNDMPYGSQANPKSAAGMTVEELAREGLPDATVHDGPYSTVIGNLSDRDKQKIAQLIQKGEPGVKNVFVTADLDDVQQLSGYRLFISRGGDMRPYMAGFLDFIRNKFSR